MRIILLAILSLALAAGQQPGTETHATVRPKSDRHTPRMPSPPVLPAPAPGGAEDQVSILLARKPPMPPPLTESSGLLGLQSATEVIKVILGLVFLSGLAYLAGTSKVQAVERKLQMSSVVTTGLPFVFLGVLAHTSGVGILPDAALWELRPVLAFGLGWIGFTAGFRFESKSFEPLPPGTGFVSVITASVPFVTVMGVCALLLSYVEHSPANTAAFLRDAMMLGTAGAMASHRPRDGDSAGSGRSTNHVDRVYSIVTLEQLAVFIGLLVVAAYFRPQDSSVAWHLPGTAWLFITLGMGTMIGGVAWGLLSKVEAGPEFTVLILGSVCFTAGMASFLRISPLVVCFIVGLILVNLPGPSKDQIREVLEHMERPVYLLFLLVTGSLWDFTAWQGWALMLLFVPARLFGKWLGVRASRHRIPGGLEKEEWHSLVFSPMGALSIAIVVNAQDLYFGPAISWMVTAVIGGAILTEIVVQIASRRDPFETGQLDVAG